MNQSGFADLKNETILNSDSLIVGILNLPNLDANSVAIIDSSNDLSDVVLNSGQLLIGRTGNTPIANNLTGTTDEVIVTNGSGTISLSLPQQIAPTSSPTFNNITVNEINGKIANDLVTGPSSAINSNLCAFNGISGEVIKDSGILSANIVTNSGTSTNGDVAVFSGASGKIITDTSIASGNLVTNSGTSTNGDVAVFSGASGKIITDTSIVSGNLVTNSGTSTNGDVAVFSGTSGKIIADTSIVSGNLVTNSGTSTNGDLAQFSGTSGKIVTDSSISSANVVLNTGGTVTSGQIAVFSGTTGRLITASGTVPGSYLPLAGGTMTGTINMGTHTITNVSGMTMTGSALGGINPVISINSTFADGNYINFGTAGRNIGVYSGGPFFFTFNSDYNTSINSFVYNSTGAVTMIELDGSNGYLQYAASGTPGSTLTPSNALTWNTSGAVTIPISLNIQSTAGLIGVTTNSNANAGSVGEVIESTLSAGSAITLTSVVNANITTISLTPGDWDIWGNILILPNASTGVTSIAGAINNFSATFPTIPQASFFSLTGAGFATGQAQSFPIGQVRWSVATTTTIYLVVYAVFTVSACKAAGTICARRRR